MSATNRGAIRNASDFYPTPLSAFEPLIKYLPKDRVYWEPACGDGRLVKALKDSNIVASGNDIINDYDFLSDMTDHDIIITNPPFSLAFEFCRHAVNNAKEIYLLLRLNFLASKKRKAWFQKNEPSALFVLSERPSFTGHGTDATDYAWIAWGSEIKGIIHL